MTQWILWSRKVVRMNEALSKTAIEFQEQDLDCLLYCEDMLEVYDSVEDFWEEWYPFDEDGYVYAPPQRLWATKKPIVGATYKPYPLG